MDKRILWTSTALTAALLPGLAMAQQVTTTSPFTVTLGVDIRHEFAVYDDDRLGANERETRLDYRLPVTIRAKADNGLEYGAYFRIRNGGGGTANGDALRSDYKYLFGQGDWGRLELGDQDNVVTTHRVYAPSVGSGQIDGGIASYVDIGYYSSSPYQKNDQDVSTKINYFTPRFLGQQGVANSGLQLGIGYTPELGDRGNNIRRTDISTAAAPSVRSGIVQSNLTSSAGDIYQNVVDLSANYSGTFSGVAVKIGAGYSLGESKTNNVDDLGVWNLGAQLSYAGFTLGGGYFDQDNSYLPKNVTLSGWNAGLSYVSGPYGIAAVYYEATAEFPGIDRTDRVYGFGGSYTLAPGLTLNPDLLWFDAENADASLHPGGKNEGVIGILRTRLRL